MLERVKGFFGKYKKIILLVLAVLLVLIVVFFSLPAPKQKESLEKTIPGADLMETVVTPAEATPAEKAAAGAAVVAKNFAEVYGSYSNQSNYENIETAMLLSSAKYKSALSSLLSQYRASNQPEADYAGVTTSAISQPEVESLDEASGRAVVLIKTQRKESSGTQANYTLKYQDIRISLVKEGGNWLVDGSSWL